jgi:hypothetical protein
MPSPNLGTFVTYYLPDGPSRGQGRAALVVSQHDNKSTGTLDVWVFGSPRSDGPKYASPLFIGDVDNGTSPGQWH